LRRSLQDYNEAIRLKPDYVDARHNRGLVRKGKCDVDRAQEDFSEAARHQGSGVLRKG
jgi:hypothetical protein